MDVKIKVINVNIKKYDKKAKILVLTLIFSQVTTKFFSVNCSVLFCYIGYVLFLLVLPIHALLEMRIKAKCRLHLGILKIIHRISRNIFVKLLILLFVKIGAILVK